MMGEITSSEGFYALTPDQQKSHRAKIGVRAEAILGQFWRDDNTEDAVRALELEGWMDVLETCSHSEIRKAWAHYQRNGPRTKAGKLYKPDAGALYKIIVGWRSKPAAKPKEQVRDRGDRVSKEAAARIMEDAGFAVKRFGGE